MAKVFVSYSRADLEAIKILVQDLEDAGHESWFDQALTGGQRWWDNILSNIRSCEVFVSGLTPDSLESQACKRELDYAVRLGKPVLPVQLSENLQPNLLPAGLSELQCVNYCRQDKRAALALGRAIGGLPKASPLPEPLPPPPPVPVSYLSTLKEKIEIESPLDYKEQITLVIELRDHFRQGRPADEIAEMLNRLKRRDDLLAKVAQEINAVLDELKRGPGPKAGTSLTTPPEPPEEDDRVRLPEIPVDATTHRHLQLDSPIEECARLMKRAFKHGESWVVEIDPKNYFVIAYNAAATPPCITVKADLVDTMRGAKAKELKALGWTTKDGSFMKGAAGAAALYATSGIAALALLNRGVRDMFNSLGATRSWPLSNGKEGLAGAAAEFALALQRVTPDVKTAIVKRLVPE
jgi:TIR domain